MSIKNSESYIFTTTVLEQSEPFKVEDLMKKLESKGLNLSKNRAKRALERLRDSWLIVERGSYYELRD